MSYQLEIDEPIDVGVRRIATELIDHASNWVEPATGDRHEAVHEVRKDCKRIRGLLRLIRPRVPELYKAENASFRDAAASLSGIRDAEAALESYDALLDAFGDAVDRQALSPARRALTLHKQRLSEEIADLDERLAAFGARMRDARERVQDWPIPGDDPFQGKSGFALLGPGLSKTYERGRKAMAEAYAEPSVESFHEWRKRAKYLRYHLRLLRPAWSPLLKSTRREVKRLGDLLGEDHDLAVLEDVLRTALGEDAGERLEMIRALICERSAQLRDEARWLGRRIYAESPKAFRKRLGRYWEIGREELRASESSAATG
jgi:CHAD domain-containing protein